MLQPNAVDYIRRTINWLAGVVFPIRCVGCGTFAEDPAGYLCRPCRKSIPARYDLSCIGCGLKTAGGYTCARCRPANPLDRVLAVADYKHPLIISAIKQFKYRFVTGMAKPLLSLSRSYIKRLPPTCDSPFIANPLVVPVPLNRRRQNWRGFNQAELLAAEIAKTYCMRHNPTLLIRTKTTRPQAEVGDRAERLVNVAGFACPRPSDIAGHAVLLIDDVCTTGATLNECARVLKAAGASRVTAFVIARG